MQGRRGEWLTEAVEVLGAGGEGVVLVEGADFARALVRSPHRAHLPLGAAAGGLLLLFRKLPSIIPKTDGLAPARDTILTAHRTAAKLNTHARCWRNNSQSFYRHC